jgi:ribosomal protein S18 acetylase RimI-like enzyme
VPRPSRATRHGRAGTVLRDVAQRLQDRGEILARAADERGHVHGGHEAVAIKVDQNIAKGLYRAAGFRVCGERAVRVDILERLADLIRPAIAPWRCSDRP